MPKEKNQTMKRLAQKATSLAAMVSMFGSLFTLGATPVSAAGGNTAPLGALSSVVSSPIRSSCSNINICNNPEYTNISYSYKLSAEADFTGNNCIGSATSGCAVLTFVTDDSSLTSKEQWAPGYTANTSTDITWGGPANSYVISATASDENADNANAYETLTVVIGCDAACTFVTTTTYTIDFVNNPMATPYAGLVFNPNYYTQYTQTATFHAVPNGVVADQSSQTVNNYGSDLNITASIDARVGFNFQGKDAVDDAFYTEGVGSTFVTSTDSGCEFGTLSPGVPKVCLFDLNISTNAPNGYKIYVVQDQNMTFNGNTFKQFENGTRTDDAAASLWSSPSLAAGGHLGYSSNDDSVFNAVTDAIWAGIPTKVAANVAASSPAGLVADDTAPGDATYIYALKIEAATTQPQAPESLNQSYSHNEYFIVVGQF